MVSEEKEITPVRIKFSKTGDLMYISHLDLARTMQRIILRAGLDIWYSEGFNPQPKMVFALPLPTGVESECELLDIKLNSYMSNEEIMERLNRNFPADMRVIEVYQPEAKLKLISYAKYRMELFSPKITSSTAHDISNLFSNSCMIEKKTKSGVKSVNICDYIQSLEVKDDNGRVVINAILCADNEKNLNPELIVEAIRKNLHIMDTVGTDEYYKIMREGLLTQDLIEFK
ncbi:MAG: DUF2344 domain-containing protein [Ruminococcaceae bacterium]|nr:DUF2344 domain-containing protein [Oscillospiraceae bacterium]